MVKCKFSDSSFGYVCFIKGETFPLQVDRRTFNGQHWGLFTNDDVRWLRIEDSSMTKIPDGIGGVYKNLKLLTILNSNLMSISKENLCQFPMLENLNLRGNQLEFLPGNLFEFNRNLREIQFHQNKIKFIGPELLDGLHRLTYANFLSNVNIHTKFDVKGMKNQNSIDLRALKELIKLKCKPPPELLEVERKISFQVIPKTVFKVKGCPLKHLSTLHEDLDKLLARDEFKDFTIKVKSANFKVHKFIFTARSETFAEIIKNNPDADELVLEDIPVEIFESILNYVYTNELKFSPENAREILAAAGKFKIIELQKEAANVLKIDMEHFEHDLDVLIDNFKLGLKFQHEDLKLKAFDEIKKHFPGKKLKDELLDEPEKLLALVRTKRLLELQLKEFGEDHEEEEEENFVEEYDDGDPRDWWLK